MVAHSAWVGTRPPRPKAKWDDQCVTAHNDRVDCEFCGAGILGDRGARVEHGEKPSSEFVPGSDELLVVKPLKDVLAGQHYDSG
jgi:hypothetical protein